MNDEVKDVMEDAADLAAGSEDESGKARPGGASDEVGDDTDLGGDFAEMDDAYAGDFKVDAKGSEEAASDEGEAAEESEVEEEVEAAAEEAAEDASSEAAEEETEEGAEEDAEPNWAEQFKALQEELAALKAEKAEQARAGTEETDSGKDVSEEAKAAHDGAIEALRKQYAMSQETADKFTTEPEAVIPQLAADLHMNVVYSVMGAIRSALPGWIADFEQGRAREQGFEEKLYGKYPALKEHSSQARTIIDTYRTVNKDLSEEQLIEQGGRMAMFSLGLKMQEGGKGNGKAKPAAQPARKPAPHRPAAATGRAGKPTGQRTVWDEMVEGEDPGL